MRRMSGPKASLSRWAMPAVGSSRQSTRAPDTMRQASSTMRRVPVDSSFTKRSTKRPRPRKAMTSSAFGPSAGSRARPGRAPARPVSPHRQVREQLGALERPPEAEAGPAGRRGPARPSCPSTSTRPELGTKPPMAFMSVDLPAPLAPMRPTTSPGRRRGRPRRRPRGRPKRTVRPRTRTSASSPSGSGADRAVRAGRQRGRPGRVRLRRRGPAGRPAGPAPRPAPRTAPAPGRRGSTGAGSAARRRW